MQTILDEIPEFMTIRGKSMPLYVQLETSCGEACGKPVNKFALRKGKFSCTLTVTVYPDDTNQQKKDRIRAAIKQFSLDCHLES